MDQFDSQRYASVYRTLAEILERERPDGRDENDLSYVLGDLTRRVFVGTHFLPPDELLEEVVKALRTFNSEHFDSLARRLREHAEHLDEVGE